MTDGYFLIHTFSTHIYLNQEMRFEMHVVFVVHSPQVNLNNAHVRITKDNVNYIII